MIREGFDALDICIRLRDAGLLAKPTHGDVVRFTPPLVINKEEMGQCCEIIDGVIRGLLK